MRSPVFVLLVSGAVIFLVALGFWWTKVHQDPYNVFWGMMENNLSSAGVTKHVAQTSDGTTLEQYLASSFGAENTVHALTTLKSSKSTVKTESVGTPSKDFVRYTAVNTNEKAASGETFDFSSILNKWASNKVENSSNTQAPTGLFTQSSLGLMGGNLFPFANLPRDTRQDLLRRLHNEDIFTTSFDKVKKERKNGRPIYTYDVNVEPVAYVGFEKAFAQALGLKFLDNVDPNNYQGQSAIKVTISVDAWSHQLVGVNYPGQEHTETYTSHGVAAAVAEPKATISGAQLQGLLGQIQ